MGKFDYQNHKSQRSSASGKVKKNPVKVTYISTPVKVKASNASEFRAIVQELTGKDSDVRDYHSDDVYTAPLPLLEEADHQVVINNHNHEADHQHTKISTTAADEYLFGDHHHDALFSSHHHILSSSLEFDDRFLWRDIASTENSFGFQSSCVSLYD